MKKKKTTPPSGGPRDPSVTRNALEGEEAGQPTNCDPHVHHSWRVIRGSRLILTTFRLFQRVFFLPPFAPPLSLFSHFFFFFFWALVGSPCGPPKFNFQSSTFSATQSVLGFFSLLFHFFISFHFHFSSHFFHVFHVLCIVLFMGFPFPLLSLSISLCARDGASTQTGSCSHSVRPSRANVCKSRKRSREGEQGANNKNMPTLENTGDEKKKKRFAHTSSCRAGQGTRRVDGSESAE